jgi:hypothetical protein
MKNEITTTSGINFTRIDNDINGNPRYVCHFLNIADNYNEAIKKANTIGGRKYHNKSYGGGIVFQSYNIEDTAKRIKELSKD